MDIQTELVLVGRLVLAAFLGAVIGYERELRGRSAGLRTFAAVALGACLFSIISYIVVPAAVGMAVGVGLYSLAVAATLLLVLLLLLRLVPWLDHRAERETQSKE